MPVVAVIGASSDRRKYGNKALRAFRNQGFTVIPVNPHETEIEGERVYSSVLAYPGPIDEASLYLQPAVAMQVLEDLAKKGVAIIWLNPGADDEAVVARARELGLSPRIACSILGIGESPEQF